MQKYYCLKVVLFFLLAGSSFSQAVHAASSCILKVGWEPWEPFQYLDSSNHLTGLDVDMIRAIVQNMGCEPRFSRGPGSESSNRSRLALWTW
jgi:polar amino acid transport system substrate-binding protein